MQQNKFLLYYIPVIVWASTILVLTSIPSIDIPDTGIDFQDKVAHFGVYFILGFLTARAFLFGKGLNISKSIFVSFALCSLFAVFDELHQLFISGRSAEINDGLADISGIMMAILMFYLYVKNYFTCAFERLSKKPFMKSGRPQD